MTRRNFKVFTILVFLLTALGIGTLLFLPSDFFSPSNREVSQTRVVIPQNVGLGGSPSELFDSQNLEDGSAARVPFAENESVISVITRDFDGDSLEEQIIAYRNPQEIDTPIFITYVEFDEKTGDYSRIWTAPTAATRPNSLILSSEDIVRDGGICVLASGMNGAGEQTLTVFRKNGSTPESVPEEAFGKIAEFIIEGSIAVQELQRSQDYQQGIRGQSLTISTYGRDYESSNMLDQIETTYTYNPVNGLYEQSRMLKIPGRQIEQRRVSELLSSPGSFEEFIDGL
ncbi:MAG: pallilysin-related adhesin, partial [Treponema sp.]|nr:pallilysin-related adhesin [Treponema sp.]